jgi:ribosomal protein L31
MSLYFSVLWRRCYQKYTHPHLFVRTVVLSDGSAQQITTLTPSPYNPPPALLGTRSNGSTTKRETKSIGKQDHIKEVDPFDDAAIKSLRAHSNPIPLKLNADSSIHPSWNRHKQRGLGEGRGEGVEKFRGRFGSDMDDILFDTPEEEEDLIANPDVVRKVVTKKKVSKK